MGWAQVENKTESTIEGEKAKLTCPMSKSSEAPQDQGNLLRGIVNWSDVTRTLLQSKGLGVLWTISFSNIFSLHISK